AATPPAARPRSCRAAVSCPTPRSAAGPILQHYAFRCQLVADAVGGREVAIFLGFGAFGDSCIGLTAAAFALEPLLARPFEQAEESGAGFERPTFKSRKARKRERRIEVIAERFENRAVHLGRWTAPRLAIQAVQRRLGLESQAFGPGQRLPVVRRE